MTFGCMFSAVLQVRLRCQKLDVFNAPRYERSTLEFRGGLKNPQEWWSKICWRYVHPFRHSATTYRTDRRREMILFLSISHSSCWSMPSREKKLEGVRILKYGLLGNSQRYRAVVWSGSERQSVIRSCHIVPHWLIDYKRRLCVYLKLQCTTADLPRESARVFWRERYLLGCFVMDRNWQWAARK